MIRDRLKQAIATFGYESGLTQAALRFGDFFEIRKDSHLLRIGRKRDPGFLILTYHRVNSERNPFMIDTVPTPLFDQQMRYLARYFNVLPLETILDRIREGQPLPRRSAAITFDDGYEDNYLYAFPILREYDLPATIFLTAGCLDTGQSLWFDLVLYAFEKTSRQAVKVPWREIPISFNGSLERSRAAVKTLYHLMAYPSSRRAAMIDAVFANLGVEKPRELENQLLRWSQVQEMAENDISFGSHTMTHQILTGMELSEAEKELSESKELIESRIDRRVRILAYPNGKSTDYSTEMIAVVRQAGYEAALTTLPGLNFIQEDPYQLRRIKSWGNTLPLFAISLAYYSLMDNIESHGD